MIEFHLKNGRRFQARHYDEDEPTSGNIKLKRAPLNVLTCKEIVSQIIVDQLQGISFKIGIFENGFLTYPCHEVIFAEKKLQHTA